MTQMRARAAVIKAQADLVNAQALLKLAGHIVAEAEKCTKQDEAHKAEHAKARKHEAMLLAALINATKTAASSDDKENGVAVIPM